MALSFSPLESESMGLRHMELSILHFLNENSDRCPQPCFEATYIVYIRSSCILSICGFADTGLLAETVHFSPNRSLLPPQILRQRLFGSAVRGQSWQPTRWKMCSLSHSEELKCFTSILSWALHPAGMYVTITLIPLLTIASGHLSKYIEIFIRFDGTCYFSSESRLTVKGQDSRDMASTAPLLAGSSKARVYQTKQHECDLVWHEPLPHPFPVTLVRSPKRPIRKFTHYL